MEHCSGENADITESEIDDYKEKSYVELKCGNQSFKISDVAYTCPYCPEKSGRHLFYEDLLQHASGIGKSRIQTARDRANHLALAKYLESDVAGAVGPSKSNKELKSGTHSFRISDVAFACPYCPETTKRDFSYKDLLQHANGIGSCNSIKRTARDKANHLALFKRLENDVAGSTSSAKSYEVSTIKKKSYEESMSGNQPLKISNMTFACPYCPETRKRKFSYKDLLQHANGIGSSNSLKRTARHKANHLALAKRLENDLAGSASSSKSYEEWRSGNHSLKLANMAFACPYCPETRDRDFSYKDLYQHVYSVGTCNSTTRTASDKANHLAVAKSLENDVAGAAGPSKSYEGLKSGNYSLKISDMAFGCAYPETRNRYSSYNDLFQHTSGVGSSNSNKRMARDKASHLAYAKYLENDVAGAAGASKSYEESTSGKHSFNISDRTFVCAYCPETRNRDFSYKDLWQHAIGVGSCDSKKRTARDKANHLALSKHLQNFAKYLEDDVSSAASTSMPYERLKTGYHSFNNSDVAFACPYCPDTRNKDFSYKDLLQHAGGVGSCNSKKRTARDKANHLALAKYLSSDVAGGASKSISYEELKRGNNSFHIPDGAYTFAYCPQKRKRDFLCKDLMLHVSEVGSCNSNKRTAKDKANHLTFAKYFENDVAGAASPSKSHTLGDPQVDSLADHDHSEMFVWPWIGVVVNLPTEFKDGRYVGESGSNLKDQLMRRGFNPTRVRTLWNDVGHSGIALVEFKKDWFGFSNAISFEKAYEADDHGKKNWEASDKKSDLYAWIARADDYKAANVVGQKLRKVGDLRTVSNIMEEESRKTRILVSSLTNAIEVKKLHIKVLEDKLRETTQSVEQLIVVNAKLRQANNEEIKKIQSSARDHFQQTFINHEKLKLQLETQKKELELRHKELQKRDAQNGSDRKKLSEDHEQNAILRTSFSVAVEEQKNIDEKVLKLAEELKKQKDELHKRIIRLEKQLDAKQAGETEVERLRVIMKHIEEESDQEVLENIDTLLKNLREKEEKYEDLVALNQTLIVKERKSNDELQEAFKELVNGLKELPRNGPIGVKRMGELDSRPFLEAMKRRYTEVEAEQKASELCSLWEEYLRDPEWHPIKVITVNGKHQAVIDDEDEKLKDLKRTYGKDVYRAVTTALTEINVYNPSGGYIISELWNYEVGEKATLQDGVTVLLNLWKKKMTLD